jgi:hypothetical protein
MRGKPTINYILGGLAVFMLLLMVYQFIIIPGDCNCPFFSCLFVQDTIRRISNQAAEDCVYKGYRESLWYLVGAFPVLLSSIAGMFVED